MAEATISIYLDTRRKKDSKLYPVKLRVYYDYTTRFYPTGIDLSKKDFESSFGAEKPRGGFKDLKIKLISHLARAQNIINELSAFDFIKFEKRLLRPTDSGSDVFYHYEQTISRLKKDDQINTARNYYNSLKSLQAFLTSRNQKTSALPFDHVSPNFLKEYEKWMLANRKEKTTVGIYLRPLRALFNAAIADSEIPQDLYPFGKRKYQIPQGRNIKKALSKDDLKKLYEYPLPDESLIVKARDFFFFSYVTNGINIKDLAELKYKNITNDSISFIRSKTKNTTKGNLKPIIAPLTPLTKQVIKRHGNREQSPETYVFPIIKAGMTETEKIRAVQVFTRFINQHMKNLAKMVGVDPDISTYYARHTFSSVAVQNGASLEFVQDSLGHGSIATTMSYWKGFEENIKKEIANKLMDF